jgi:hypothetical protein
MRHARATVTAARSQTFPVPSVDARQRASEPVVDLAVERQPPAANAFDLMAD